MQREPNPYAQQPAYTVTQTMAISVPSVVAEDVLDGEDGGLNEVDNAAMQELQSDMVELKSDVADLSSQLNTVNDDVQQLTSQCIELKETTVAANYKGNAKGDLTLTINGSNGSLYLSAKDAYNSITQLDRYALQVALADLYDEDARYTFVNGVLSKSTNEGVSWDPISSSSSGSNNQALSINGLDALSFSCNYDTHGTIVVQGSTTDASGLAYYPLATSSFANVDTIACRMKPVSNGIAYSNDYGNTWTTITATSGSDSGSDSGSSSNIELKDPLSSLQVTGLSDYTLLLQAAYKDDPSALGYCTLVVNGIANVDNPTCRLRVTPSGAIQTSTNAGSTWTTITSSESLVLDGALTKVYMSAQTYSEPRESVIELAATLGTAGSSQQYALAVPAIANSASPGAQMRPTMNGIETSLDYGKTWKLLSVSSGDSTDSGSGVYFSNSYDSGISSAYINYNGSNVSVSLNGTESSGVGLIYPLCQPLADIAHPLRAGTQLAFYDGAICLGSDYDGWRQISSADLSDGLSGDGMESLISLDPDNLNELEFVGMYTAGYKDVLAMRANGGSNTSLLSYYSLAAPAIFWIHAPTLNPTYAMRPTAQGLEWSGDAGQTWNVLSPLSPIESLLTGTPVTTTAMEHNDVLNLYKADEYEVVRFTYGVNSTSLDYHLQTTLCAVGIHETPFKDIDVATRTRLALVEGAVQASQPKLKYTYDGGDTWHDFNIGSGDSQTGSDGSTSTAAEFVPVKYLGNTGTQYIDTGYVLQEDDILEVDYEIPESALNVKTDKILIDARDDSYGVRVSTYSGTYKWYARFGHNESQTSTAITSSLQGSLTLSKGQFILNGAVVFNSLVFSAMPTGTLKLLAGVNYETGVISAPSYARISACKIKRNGETIRNFRPVQRTADGELGMRDAVTGEFFTNAGTGVFDYLPSDVVEAGTVVKKPTLTEEQKLALQALMDDYYNNRGTFFYEFTHNRNAFTSGGQCYDSTKGKFKQCCATFVQHIMMGRSVNDFVGKTGSTYSPNITKTAVSDFGYYFDFKYRKYLYGLTGTDESGNEVYYGYNQPNADNFEGSYSYNSYYHPDSKNTNKQNFNGFCNANDMARELYEMGCEIPFAELDVGDIIFTLDNDLSDNSSMFNFHAWRNIYHVGMVYDVKQIDASSKEIYYIECTSYFDVDNRPIEKPFLSSDQMDLRFKAFKLTEDMAFCARMPIAFGYKPNVPEKITTSATPS